LRGRGEPQSLPPALEGHEPLDGPGGEEEKDGKHAENDRLMPALFLLFLKKPGRCHASEAAPEPKLAQQRGLKAKLEEDCRIERPEEMKFSFPDQWSVRLFIALCRRYGLKPYRYPRQRKTTVMVKAPRRFFDAVVWRQFSEVHT
jgi:hypothetical protein